MDKYDNLHYVHCAYVNALIEKSKGEWMDGWMNGWVNRMKGILKLQIQLTSFV